MKAKTMIATALLTAGLGFGVIYTPANAAIWYKGTPGFLYNKRYRPNNVTKDPMIWGTKTRFHIDWIQNNPKAYHPIWKYSHHVYTIRSTTYWITSAGKKEVMQYQFAKIKRFNRKTIFAKVGFADSKHEKTNYIEKHIMPQLSNQVQH